MEREHCIESLERTQAFALGVNPVHLQAGLGHSPASLLPLTGAVPSLRSLPNYLTRNWRTWEPLTLLVYSRNRGQGPINTAEGYKYIRGANRIPSKEKMEHIFTE